jgi:hypothetical protein
MLPRSSKECGMAQIMSVYGAAFRLVYGGAEKLGVTLAVSVSTVMRVCFVVDVLNEVTTIV